MYYEYTFEVEQPRWLEVTVEVRVTKYWSDPETYDEAADGGVEWDYVGWSSCDQNGHEECGSGEPPYSVPEDKITDHLFENYPYDMEEEL